MLDLTTFKDSPLKSMSVETLITESLKLEQAPIEISHFFGPGVYIKECRVPKNTYAIGEVHKGPCTNILIKGRVSIANDQGGFTELVAPMTFVSQPGRKIGYFHEDTIWQNIFATEETDLDKLENMFVEKHPELVSVNQQKLLSNDSSEDKKDYIKLLEERGVTEEDVRKIVENTSDITELPYGNYKFTISDSSIEGKGLIAVSDINPGEVIGFARIGIKRTQVGRYTNHSPDPNSYPRLNGNGCIELVAKKLIRGCKGGSLGDEITVNYRDSSECAKLLDEEIKSCLHL